MALVMVTLDREDRGVIDRFKQDIRNTAQVTNGYYITGDADFILTVVARDMDEYDEFTRDFFYDRHPIKTFKTCVIMNVVKTHGPLPVHPDL